MTEVDGTTQHVYVDRRSLIDGTLEIGYPVGERDGALLVELPRETHTGWWRVWVSPDQVVAPTAAVAA